MNTIIYKKHVSLDTPFKGPKDITFGIQNKIPVVWYDPDMPETCNYIVVFTGVSTKTLVKAKLIATAQDESTGLVYHLLKC